MGYYVGFVIVERSGGEWGVVGGVVGMIVIEMSDGLGEGGVMVGRGKWGDEVGMMMMMISSSVFWENGSG